MSKKSLIITFISVLFAIVCFWLYLFYSAYKTEQNSFAIKLFFDNQIKQLHKSVEDAKLSSMAIAVLLGQNNTIHMCFLDDNRDGCLKNIKELIKTLSAVSMYNDIKIHLHTNDLKSYVRSWDTQRYGDTLVSFRHLLNEAKNSKKPVSGIEAGVAGVFIRAVSNVTYNNQNIGSIEVLLNFENIGKFYKEQGVDLYVLIDKVKSKATKDETNSKILDDFYIENLSSANLNSLEILRDIEFNKVNFYEYKTHFFSIVPLIDASGQKIGYYVLHINTDAKERNISQNYQPLDGLF
ncbi:chemotaxis protein [Campylobacter sp. faydin G-24]|uniref:Chemotaxis protein n=1 Tax=Campylobacter anatolicus TaxID=2829105 RepID=A0ABS5HHB5_9BACT|nr:cache domain-containing protein [Campylobacter anatolicus]MBR8462595.1 chemotaxis protein [Campylobacter anatolicus]MBR8462972.1 chemotaxis protein [Campylobacter anatolicus]